MVGWPPVRSYRKNTMATSQLKSSKEESDAKQGQGFLYVKVSMDGAPYLRKVDLKTYKSYKELSLGLEKMFVGFSTGKIDWVQYKLTILSCNQISRGVEEMCIYTSKEIFPL